MAKVIARFLLCVIGIIGLIVFPVFFSVLVALLIIYLLVQVARGD